MLLLASLLVAGAAIHNDWRREVSEATPRTHHAARGAVAAVAVAAVLLALYLPESIFSRVLFAWNALGAAFGPVVVTRLLGWGYTGWSVPASIFLGFGLTVVFYSLPDGPGDLWERCVPFLIAWAVLAWNRR